MCEPSFPFPLLQQFTSHSHVRHGICSHHILHTASLELLKIKNVANHKYLKSPGAGICTVFKQTFLIWYLFFSITATRLSQGSFFPPFPFSGSRKFHVALAQQQQSITNPIAQLCRQEVRLQPLLTPSPPLSAFLLGWILFKCVVI